MASEAIWVTQPFVIFGNRFNPPSENIIKASQEAFFISKASDPLPPEVLVSARGKMNQANFNWLFISVWRGLRPQEIDNLHDQQLWRIETPIVGRKIFWIYQTKIIALPPDDRWKPISIFYEEQEFASRIIQSENFKSPLVKTMRQYFSKEIDLDGTQYSGSDMAEL